MSDDLEREVARLREEVRNLQQRVAALEEDTEDGDGNDATAVSEDLDRPVESATEARPADAKQGADAEEPAHAAEAADAAKPTADSSEDRDWEQLVGGRWLPLFGAAALVIGVVFFVQVAIERGLLGHLGRVVAGTLGGLALLAIGRYAAESQGYVRWGRIAAGAGLAIAYFSVYAAYGFEAYREAIGTQLWTVLLGQTLLIGGAVALSVRDRSAVVGGQAFLLGYATAFLALDAGTFLLTPAYVLLLAAGLVAVAAIRPWRLHVAGSVLPTYVLLGIWIADADPAATVWGAVVAGAFLLYVAGAYALARSPDAGRLRGYDMAALTVSNGAIAAFALEIAVRNALPDAPVGGLGVLVVAAVLLVAHGLTTTQPVRRDDAAGALGVALAALGLAFAADQLGLDGLLATVALVAGLLGSVALAHVADRDDLADLPVHGPALRTGAHVVAVGTALKLVTTDASDLPAFDLGDPVTIVAGRPTAFGLAIGACYGLAWWWTRTGVGVVDASERARSVGADPSSSETILGDDSDWSVHRRFERSFPLAPAYAVLGTVLAVILLGLELSGLGTSVAWALFGLALVAGGLSREVRGLRLLGMGVLALATVKVFVFDTSDLDLLARTASFLALGVVLLVTSYAYARWQGQDPLAGVVEE